MFKRIFNEDRAVAATEMALIVLLIATVAFAAVGLFGGGVQGNWDLVQDSLDGQVTYGDGSSGDGGGAGDGETTCAAGQVFVVGEGCVTDITPPTP